MKYCKPIITKLTSFNFAMFFIGRKEEQKMMTAEHSTTQGLNNARLPTPLLKQLKVYSAINDTNIVDTVDEALTFYPIDFGERMTYEDTKSIKVSTEAHEILKERADRHQISMTQVLSKQIESHIERKKINE